MPFNDSAPLPNGASVPKQIFVLVLPNGLRLTLSVPTTNVDDQPTDSPPLQFEFTSVKVADGRKVSRRNRSDSATSTRNGLSCPGSDHVSISHRAEVPAKYRKVVREWFAQIFRDLSENDRSSTSA
jgi:hypothetical protein